MRLKNGMLDLEPLKRSVSGCRGQARRERPEMSLLPPVDSMFVAENELNLCYAGFRMTPARAQQECRT